MNEDQARKLGSFLRARRLARQLSTHELAELAGVNQTTIVRLEQGAYLEPSIDKLRTIAQALGLNVSNLLAMATYVVPDDLPHFAPYLRTKYRDLPAPAVSELERSFRRIAKKHGFD